MQGLLTLGTMTGPLLVVLSLIPQGVLAGLFFIMGYQALEGNGITLKLLFLLRDKRLTTSEDPLSKVSRRAAIWSFVALELVGFGATFAITQTVAAVGFPCFIFALIPVRALLLPKLFTPQELAALDAPTASDFIMENVGGTYGAVDSATASEVEREGEGEGRRRARDEEEVVGGVMSGSSREGGVLREKRSGSEGVFGSQQQRRDGTVTEEELAELGEGRSVRLSTSESAGGARRRS